MKKPIFFENSKLPDYLSKFSPIEIVAITLGPFVFCKGMISERTRRHETIHFHQYVEMWYIGFIFWYLVDFLYAAVIKKKGFTYEAYSSIRFEQEASENDMDEEYLLHREKKAWKNYPLGGE